ncbi:unnamed protein product [Rhizophagus irregularis]|nr:unnamed protein product [Rhizophagus irregularis]
MKASNVIIICCTIYSVACICSEIVYLVILHKIGDHNDHGVHPGKFLLIYTSAFHFIGNFLVPLIYLMIYARQGYFNKVFKRLIESFLYLGGFNYFSPRFFFLFIDLGEVPFNCDFKYHDDLPKNVKIACKTRLTSCILENP